VNALWAFLPFALQGLLMGIDEGWFHRRRKLPRREWTGHALDASVFLGCLLVPLLRPPTPSSLGLFAGLGVLSCLLITKDEFIHQRLCTGGEHWVHAVLFLLHPVVLAATALLWLGAGPGVPPWLPPWLPVPHPAPALDLLRLQAALVAAFLAYQLVYWPLIDRPGPPEIDNALYEDLGERWYSATDDPVALLRAEARLRTAWVLEALRAHFGRHPLAILDVACGAGFLANPLAEAGHDVTGIDLSPSSLEVARRHDPTASVTYLVQDAGALAFPDGHFDVVCMMDFLEHVEDRDLVLREASRVLRPGGWFLFHTFNRNPVSGLVALKGVEWFVRNTPRHMHVYRLFLKPEELEALCARHHLAVEDLRGVRPRILSRAFLRLLFTGRVGDDFQFLFTPSRLIAYCGRARKTT
jgi:2-polyprenyl-6-hydroxyphenyl methylase / 3-demethylubiquinone-9 3-methyltransferase